MSNEKTSIFDIEDRSWFLSKEGGRDGGGTETGCGLFEDSIKRIKEFGGSGEGEE